MSSPSLLRLLRRLDADPEPPNGNDGRWPTAKQGVLWDLLPAKTAPRNDGVEPPTWSQPWWVAAAANGDLADLLAAERLSVADAQTAAATTEGKASRLLGTTVTLLTASVALTALQLRASTHTHGVARAVLVAAALPAATACVLLVLSAVRALDADLRVGVYGTISAQVQFEHGRRGELEKATVGASLSQWTARHKATALMDARAWFTRALLAAVLGLGLAAVTVAVR